MTVCLYAAVNLFKYLQNNIWLVLAVFHSNRDEHTARQHQNVPKQSYRFAEWYPSFMTPVNFRSPVLVKSP